MITLSPSYRTALLKKYILPWGVAVLTLLITALPLSYWQYQQTQKAQHQYQKKLKKLKKTQLELNRLIAEINKFRAAQQQLKRFSSLNLFTHPSRDQWADTLLLYAAARVLPDIQYTLEPAELVPNTKNLYTTPLHITLTGYHELESFQLYQSLRQTITPFIEWQHCRWGNNTRNSTSPAQSTSQLTASAPAQGQAGMDSYTAPPLNTYIQAYLNKQKNFIPIQTECDFRVFYASAPQATAQKKTTSALTEQKKNLETSSP